MTNHKALISRDKVSAWLLLVSFFSLSFSFEAKASGKVAPRISTQETLLEVGRPVERELAGGNTYSHQIRLAAGQYLHLVVEQKGIDVVVKLFGPDGKLVTEVDSPNGTEGPEPITLVAEATGDYRLEVSSPDKEAKAGRCEARVVELRAASQQDRDRLIAQKILNEARQLLSQGSRDAITTALKKFEEALPMFRALKDQDTEAATLTYIADVYRIRGEPQKALEYYLQALPMIREEKERHDKASTQVNIGIVYMNMGEPQKALEYYEQALALLRNTEEKAGIGITLTNIGYVYRTLGELQKALEYYNQGLTLTRESGNKNFESITLVNLGDLYSLLGDFEKSLEYRKQALALAQALGDKRLEAIFHNNLGDIYQNMGDLKNALENYNQALALVRTVGDRRNEAVSLSNVASAYRDLGETQKALEYYAQALESHRASGSRILEASALLGLGRTYYNMGELEKAAEQFDRALEIHRAVRNTTGEIIVQRYRAMAARDRGNLSEARDRIEKAISLMEFTRARLSGQESRASFSAVMADYYELNINLLMRMHAARPDALYDRAALSASEQARARILLELLNEARAEIRQGVDVQLLGRERDLKDRITAKLNNLTRLLSGKPTPEQRAAAEREVDALTDEYRRVQTEIRRRSPSYAALTQPQPLSVEAIQRTLDAETLLLEYALGKNGSYVWAVTADSVHSYELLPKAEIEAATRRVYELITARQSPITARAASDGDSKYWDEASALSRMLLGPVAQHLGGKRLVIVADGALQYLPFGALPAPSEISNLKSEISNKPLIADHEIVSLPSASTLALLRRETAGRNPARNIVAVLADPVFTGDDPRVRAGRGSAQAPKETGADSQKLVSAVRDVMRAGREGLSRLPFSREEAEAIWSVTPQGVGLKALGFRANRETATGDQLGQYRIVHFATHALFNSKRPELSGLVLSLVDETGRAQDGFLSLHDIYNLRLPAEVVVLSACQTGLGKDVRGEGMIGPVRGFMYAGSPRVVASLWQVDDLATAELMKRFYKGMLKDGLRPAAALRAAQVDMWSQKRWRSPYFWSAFVLQGEWR